MRMSEHRKLVTLLIFLCVAVVPQLSAQPSILTHPVDATVCLNSTAEFYCSTDGEYVVWRLNGTKKARGYAELKQEKFLHHSGVGKTLFVPGVRKFENTNITCTGGIPGGGTATSNPVQLFVQGPPSPPSELTATPLNEASIKLTWSVPPGVLDEGLISYLVEVRNESSGLIVFNETDGTEYTFSMDNPDPCDLYSFTVTPLCGTVEGGTSAEVTETFFDVAEQVTVMDFTLELMDSGEAMVTLTVPHSDGVCSYSVTATSTDGEPLFTDNKFPSLAGESTVSISLQLPTSEEYYITVSACNALGCGPPSSPLTISTFNVQSVMITSEGNIRCYFIKGTSAIGCLTIFTGGSATMPWYSGAERHGSTAVGSVELPHGSYSWSVFGVESTGLPEHSAAITGTLLVEGYKEIHVNPPSVDVSITISSMEKKVCVKLGSGPKKVVLFHSLHDHVEKLWCKFLNENNYGDDSKETEACFNGVSSEYAVAVFEGSVLNGETPYMEKVVMDTPLPSTTPVHSPTTTTTLEVSKDKITVASICGVVVALLLILCIVLVIVLFVCCRKGTKKQGTKASIENEADGIYKPLPENESNLHAVSSSEPSQEEKGLFEAETDNAKATEIEVAIGGDGDSEDVVERDGIGESSSPLREKKKSSLGETKKGLLDTGMRKRK